MTSRDATLDNLCGKDSQLAAKTKSVLNVMNRWRQGGGNQHIKRAGVGLSAICALIASDTFPDEETPRLSQDKAQRLSGLAQKDFKKSYQELSSHYQESLKTSTSLRRSSSTSNSSTPTSQGGRISRSSPNVISPIMQKLEGESQQDYAKRVATGGTSPSLSRKKERKNTSSKFGGSSPVSTSDSGRSLRKETGQASPSGSPLDSKTAANAEGETSTTILSASAPTSSNLHEDQDRSKAKNDGTSTSTSTSSRNQTVISPSTPHRSEKRNQSANLSRTPSSAASPFHKFAAENSARKAQQEAEDLRRKERGSVEADHGLDNSETLPASPSKSSNRPISSISTLEKGKGKARELSSKASKSNSSKVRTKERYAFPIRESIGISKDGIPREQNEDEIEVREWIEKWMPHAESLFGDWKSPEERERLKREKENVERDQEDGMDLDEGFQEEEENEADQDQVENEDNMFEAEKERERIESSDNEERRASQQEQIQSEDDEDEEEDSEEETVMLVESPISIKSQNSARQVIKKPLNQNVRKSLPTNQSSRVLKPIISRDEDGLTIRSTSRHGLYVLEMNERKVKRKGEDVVEMRIQRRRKN